MIFVNSTLSLSIQPLANSKPGTTHCFFSREHTDMQTALRNSPKGMWMNRKMTVLYDAA